MRLRYSDEAIADLNRMDRSVFNVFVKALDNLLLKSASKHMAGKHMGHGLPYYRKEVGSGRIVYQIRGDEISVVRCFTTHKEYDKWWKKHL